MSINSIAYSGSYDYYYPLENSNNNTQIAYAEEPKQLLPKGNIGSAKTEIAKKGIKQVWKSIKSFFKKLISGDKEIQQKIIDAYDIYDNSQKIVTTYNDFSDLFDNHSSPRQNYRV